MLSIPWDICSVCNLNYFISRLFISMVFWKGLESLLMDFMIMSYRANPRQILFWLYLLYLLRGDYIPYTGWCLSQSDRFLCFRVLWREEDGTSNIWLNLLKMWFFFKYCFSGRNFSRLNEMHCKPFYHKCNTMSTFFSAVFLRTERFTCWSVKLFL